MHTVFSILIVLEVVATLFTAWCIMNEKKLIVFEDRVISAVKMRLCRRAKIRAAQKRRRLNARVRYTPEVPQRKTAAKSHEAA